MIYIFFFLIFCAYILNYITLILKELWKLTIVKVYGWLDTDRIGSIERAHGYSTNLLYQKKSITKEPFLYNFF